MYMPFIISFILPTRPTIHPHPSSSILIHPHPSSSILIHPHPSTSILIHPHPSSSIHIHPHPSTSIHIHPSSSIYPSIHPSIHPSIQGVLSKFAQGCAGRERRVRVDSDVCMVVIVLTACASMSMSVCGRICDWVCRSGCRSPGRPRSLYVYRRLADKYFPSAGGREAQLDALVKIIMSKYVFSWILMSFSWMRNMMSYIYIILFKSTLCLEACASNVLPYKFSQMLHS